MCMYEVLYVYGALRTWSCPCTPKSSTSVSAAKRFVTMPTGVASKKLSGAARTAASIRSCRLRAGAGGLRGEGEGLG